MRQVSIYLINTSSFEPCPIGGYVCLIAVQLQCMTNRLTFTLTIRHSGACKLQLQCKYDINQTHFLSNLRYSPKCYQRHNCGYSLTIVVCLYIYYPVLTLVPVYTCGHLSARCLHMLKVVCKNTITEATSTCSYIGIRNQKPVGFSIICPMCTMTVLTQALSFYYSTVHSPVHSPWPVQSPESTFYRDPFGIVHAALQSYRQLTEYGDLLKNRKYST